MYGETKINSIAVLYEKNTGGETVATEKIIRELKKIPSLKVFASSSPPLAKTDFISFYSWIIKSIVRWSEFVLANKNSDWIYTTTYTAGVSATLIKIFGSYKMCFHYHGSRIPEKPKNGNLLTNLSRYSKYLSVLLLHRIFLFFTDLIIAPSPETSKNLIKVFPFLDMKKTDIIPDGVDFRVFKPLINTSLDKLRKTYGIAAKGKVITYIGRINKEKRIEILIDSLIYLKRINPGISMLICHPEIKLEEEKKYRIFLLRLIDKLQLSKSCIWIKNSKNLNEVYAVSDLVILTSKIETFSLVMLESLASKTIFMGTPVGGIKDLLTKIDDNLIINSLNSKNLSRQIIKVLNFPKKKKNKLKTVGYHLVKDYGWSNIGRQLHQSLLKFT